MSGWAEDIGETKAAKVEENSDIKNYLKLRKEEIKKIRVNQYLKVYDAKTYMIDSLFRYFIRRNSNGRKR